MISLKTKFTFKTSSNIHQLVRNAKQKFLDESLGFKRLPTEWEKIKKDLERVDNLTKSKDTIVIIGIGGSDLGTRAIHRAVNGLYYNQNPKGKKIYFTGDTTDPEAITELEEVLNLKKTIFFVVSKSGNTIEQASVFTYFRSIVLANGLKDTEHFVFLTDPTTGTLREIAVKDGYETFDIPSDVGGRFSVLSTVGVIPVHLVGINVEQLLKGALDLHKEIEETQTDIVSKYTELKLAAYKEDRKSISVLMPYQYSLYEFAKWYQQLWGESIGKKLNTKGEDVFEGQTPIAALGPVDQHSQLQLFNEGPNDKFFTLIKATQTLKALKTPENMNGLDQFNFFKGKSFQEILNYELDTTAFSLTRNKRPNVTLEIPQINEYFMGQLFYFFEVAVTLFGYALSINPFDQPGVELSKNAMYGVLGKAGYEEIGREFEEYSKES